MNTRQGRSSRPTTVLVVLGHSAGGNQACTGHLGAAPLSRRDNPRVRDRPAQRNGAADPRAVRCAT